MLSARTALVHARSSKALKAGATVLLPGGRTARLLDREGDLFRLEFSDEVLPFLETFGEVPLPPYIERPPEEADRERYQTVYAREPGAVAAPTAGLHFDSDMFAALEARGVRRAFVTLHVGAGTFQPVREDEVERHEMHAEYLEVSAGACAAIEAARAAGGRVVAVGTTVVRSLETAALAAQGRDDSAGAESARPIRPYRRDDPHFHQAGLQVPRGRRHADQLSPARVDPGHAVRGIRRQGASAGRLRPRGRGEIPIFQLR